MRNHIEGDITVRGQELGVMRCTVGKGSGRDTHHLELRLDLGSGRERFMVAVEVVDPAGLVDELVDGVHWLKNPHGVDGGA